MLILKLLLYLRLAPEYKYPSPVEDVVKAYEHLVTDLNVDPAKVIVTGDSAGASLTLEMLFLTHDPSMFEIVTDDPDEEAAEGPLVSELPRPAGAVFVSPIVTDETTSESWRQNTKYDFISQNTARVSMYYLKDIHDSSIHLLGHQT